MSFCFTLLFCTCHKNAGSNHRSPITKDERLKWFKESKFGIIIHWGLYSQFAGEWENRKVPVGENAEWIMQKLKIPVSEYRKMAREFNPVKFDAEEWVGLIKNAGAKYLVITAKHHDGFAMYHSEVDNYNIVDATPFKRDPMKELAAACRKENIKFCFYYSHREDWDHPDAYGNDWDYDVSKKNFERYLEEKSKPQLREILKGYGSLGLIWFDRGMYTQKQGEEFVSIVRQLQPGCLINGRVGNYDKELLGDYQNLIDNGMPVGGIEEYWETPQTLNETWSYSKFDNKWKSPGEIILRLVEVVSRGGNYLLNIGPTGEGLIPQASIDILNKVGEWMKKNGESIYGTTSSPFRELLFGKCTVKGEKIFLHVFNWPSDGSLELNGLKNDVKNAFFLTDRNYQLRFRKEKDAIIIEVPRKPLDEINTVIVLEIDGEADVSPPVVMQSDDGSINLEYVEAITGGRAIKRFNRKGKFHISKWTGPDDTITWYFNLHRPGLYKAEITYAANEEWKGRKYSVSAGGNIITPVVENTGDWYEYKTFTIGTVNLRNTGTGTLIISPDEYSKNSLMYFKSIKLIPVDE